MGEQHLSCGTIQPSKFPCLFSGWVSARLKLTQAEMENA